MQMKLRTLAIAALLSATALVVIFYSTTRSQSRVTVSELHLEGSAINSIQHSLGAARLYAMFYPTGIKPRLTGAVIEGLGHVNEWVEHAFKPNKDSTEEVYKDLHNNLVGLTAAKWMAERYGWRVSARQRRAVIAELARSRELAYIRDDALVPRFGTGNATAPAMTRYRLDRKGIARQTRTFLDAHSARIDAQISSIE